MKDSLVGLMHAGRIAARSRGCQAAGSARASWPRSCAPG